MANSLITSDTTNALKIALDGLSKRSQTIGRNLANMDTPGFKAQNINFETAVKRALQNSETGELKMAATQSGHLAAPSETVAFQNAVRPGGSERADGNNVDVDVELSQMAETGVRYQALTQMISRKFGLIKTITASR
jgi:flagellar basal-body rod protein FlgB